MARRQPTRALDQIRGLVGRGQVEIVGGGFYEPILVTLPDRDRLGQLVRMRDELEMHFGQRPRGAWLAERVWEPSLPTTWPRPDTSGPCSTTTTCGRRRSARTKCGRPFTTDDQGKRLTVFGTEQGLRYRIPFQPVEEVISYLSARRDRGRAIVGMMGDDGEKFGAWPGTYEYCWGHEYWVDRLFSALEGSGDWLATVTPSEWLDRQPPTRRVYVPTASYVEMTEWVLPPDETPVFVRLLEEARGAQLARSEVPARRLLAQLSRPVTARSTNSTSRC